MKVENINSVKEIIFSYDEILSNEGTARGSIFEWSNGEGFTYFNRDDTAHNFTWDEWGALVKVVRLLK